MGIVNTFLKIFNVGHFQIDIDLYPAYQTIQSAGFLY